MSVTGFMLFQISASLAIFFLCGFGLWMQCRIIKLENALKDLKNG